MTRSLVALSCLIALVFVFESAATVADDAPNTAVKPAPADGAETPEVSKPSVVPVFSLSGPIAETPPSDLGFPFHGAQPESLKGLVERLKKAQTDDRVRRVVVLLENPQLGLGQIEELREAFEALKSAGKEVHAHVDTLTLPQYALLAAASRISMPPNGYLFLTGFYLEQPFVRGLLDKIGVQPDFLTCGEYKSAAEMFMRTQPSAANARMTNWLLDSWFESVVTGIAAARGLGEEQVRVAIDSGLFSATQAKDLGLIDAVEFRRDFVTHLKQDSADNFRLAKRYGKKKMRSVDFSSPFALFSFWGEILGAGRKKAARRDAVAIVYVDGPILPGSPTPDPFGGTTGAYSVPISKALEKVAADDSIKAVVLRVNSPGGSAVASEVIHDATQRVRSQKPFVVSMGDIAGSGGYYVACGAEVIFADASTLTGSIGVVGGKFATTEMWKRLGVEWKPYARGSRAGIMRSGAVFRVDERDRVQEWMDGIYAKFKERVRTGRGGRLKKPIDEVAGGRVYTGRQALELGLVDRLGGLAAAVEFAAAQAQLERYDVRIVPRPQNFMETLFEGLGGSEPDDDETLWIRSTALGGSGKATLIDALLPLLAGLEPQRVRAVEAALVQLELFRHEPVLMSMPILTLGASR